MDRPLSPTGGECVARHLDGYDGILEVDGYAACNRHARVDRGNDAMTLAGCWAHATRKFYELHVNKGWKLASRTVPAMVRLWTPVVVRIRQFAPIIAEFFAIDFE